MATITWWSGPSCLTQVTGSSGVGFFGAAGFGASVQVGDFASRAYITSSAGTTLGPEASNTKYLTSGTVIVGQTGSGIALTALPNVQCPIQIRFSHNSPVRTTNTVLRAFNRVDPNADPSGVTVAAAECIHPSDTQENVGSGSVVWSFIHGSGQTLVLAESPGCSGHYAGNGTNSTWSDTEHLWACAVSLSPDSLGSKTDVGLYVLTEYL
jgi:hypothetical protein